MFLIYCTFTFDHYFSLFFSVFFGFELIFHLFQSCTLFFRLFLSSIFSHFSCSISFCLILKLLKFYFFILLPLFCNIFLIHCSIFRRYKTTFLRLVMASRSSHISIVIWLAHLQRTSLSIINRLSPKLSHCSKIIAWFIQIYTYIINRWIRSHCTLKLLTRHRIHHIIWFSIHRVVVIASFCLINMVLSHILRHINL